MRSQEPGSDHHLGSWVSGVERALPKPSAYAQLALLIKIFKGLWHPLYKLEGLGVGWGFFSFLFPNSPFLDPGDISSFKRFP